MTKIPYALFDGYEEMVEANNMLASMFNAKPLEGLTSYTGSRTDRSGYLIVRNGRVKYSFQGVPWSVEAYKGRFEEIPLKVNLEND